MATILFSVFHIFIKKYCSLLLFFLMVFCRIFYPASVYKSHVCSPRTKISDWHIIGVCELSQSVMSDSL